MGTGRGGAGQDWAGVIRAALMVASAAIAVLTLGVRGPAQAQVPGAAGTWLDPLRADVTRLISAATADDFAWQRLAELTDAHGSRLSGSENLARAIVWAQTAMKADGLENVRAERVTVPHWVRGRESAEIVDAPRRPLAVLGMGGTVATPPGGIEAEVLRVTSYDDLNARASAAKGKIVLFDVPYTNYSETVAYRTGGASMAAQHGAVAVLVRAVGPIGLRTPHTGSVQYVGARPKLPALSVAGEDANRLARLLAGGRAVRVRVHTEGHYAPDAPSANVVGEIRGREKPEEIVLLGGHLDSWDVGAGASDNGVGCVVTWEAVRLMKRLGLRPRRTVRVVLWTNEENGLAGAAEYARKHAADATNHVFALESDSGVFAPAALGFSGSLASRLVMGQIGTLLAPLGLADIGPGGGGADIAPIAQAGSVPMMAYLGDASRYFVIHHTEADTVERIAPEEVSKAAAAIAAISYVVAEMPDRLPR
jgi:carboxypeptidase Q